MHKSNRLFHGTMGAAPSDSRKWLCILAIAAILATSLCLPLWANTIRRDSVMDDVRDGVRNFGREVSDLVDPDHNGILPDGSIDNGIANDGNQNTPSTTVPGVTQNPADTTAVTTDRAPETTANTTRPATTTRPNGAPNGDVSGNAQDGNTTNDATDTTNEGGFPWVGILIALIIVAAVVLLIVMMLPRKDRHNR